MVLVFSYLITIIFDELMYVVPLDYFRLVLEILFVLFVGYAIYAECYEVIFYSLFFILYLYFIVDGQQS